MHPEDLEDLPIDARTGEPIPPLSQPGYYPDYHVLEQQAFWDEATRKVVLARVNDVPPIRFFSPEDAALYQAVFDRLIPQHDRDAQHRIPILNFVDERLFKNESDGYRYEKMPSDRDAYRLGADAIRALCHELHGKPFEALGSTEQDALLKTLHHGKPTAAHAHFEKLPAERFFLLILHDAAKAYYSHPYAWDEIGFGGPAYPRGYMRLEGGQPEPWESDEQRYEWEPPRSAGSGGYELVTGTDTHGAQPGQGGTH